MMGRWQIVEGDCLDALRAMGDASVDSVVTDPPAGIAFMGKTWDSDKGGRRQWVAWLTEVMGECLRVLKPGGHALVWALPRTSHWTATAIEDAGFEIRDTIVHLFGSGFPKSLDVSKAIDRAAGAERVTIGVKRGIGGENLNDIVNGRDVRSMDDEGGRGMGAYGVGAKQTPVDVPITAPATEDAKRWEGWGTALKPGHEAWILARKPLIGSVAANVLAHGTGALNIDGCRIGMDDADDAHRVRSNAVSIGYGGSDVPFSSGGAPGRWPANVILSEQAAAELDEMTGESTSGQPRDDRGTGGIWSASSGVPVGPQYGDSGGASRFYYVPKPSTAERNAGLAGMPERANRINALRENEAAKFAASRGNHHPTVKSIALMAYLCRLITPPGGTVLDCFAGSGTTGMAALVEGFSFVGIEREPEYAEIARRRIAWQAAQGRQGSLF